MHCQLLKSIRLQHIDARIVPDIGAVPAVPSQLDVVDMRCAPAFEDEDQLVLRAVKAAHAGITLVPDAEIFWFPIWRLSGAQEVADVPPIHKDECDRTV